MLSFLTGQLFIILAIIGVLILIPIFFINRRSSFLDQSMYNKDFDASKKLKAFKSSEREVEPDANKKLKDFKMKK